MLDGYKLMSESMYSSFSFSALALAASLGAGTCLTTPAFAGAVGLPSDLKFSPAILSSFCDLNIGSGSLGSNSNRKEITSDNALPGQYSGSRTAGSIAATSNLDTTGAVVIDPPVLTGGTNATSNELTVYGSGKYQEQSIALSLDDSGTLKSTLIDVKFTTTENKGRFADGVYGAQANVTCTDNGKI